MKFKVTKNQESAIMEQLSKPGTGNGRELGTFLNSHTRRNADMFKLLTDEQIASAWLSCAEIIPDPMDVKEAFNAWVDGKNVQFEVDGVMHLAEFDHFNPAEVKAHDRKFYVMN